MLVEKIILLKDLKKLMGKQTIKEETKKVVQRRVDEFYGTSKLEVDPMRARLNALYNGVDFKNVL